ncbi:DUF1684 domain-containing protein [Tenacibaculum maritimum]|uniref:DUF1684 domain-containing protein n=1 Tax=Tenacibaculum maritimum TaxID=107401 RepID=UPI0012E5C29A|nr:DUF1684 domain-containing protein [Tenacibaculum maritimum]CAA0194367.1 conserved exported hypothetical protein [Tenacibaculum maritimum]
MKVYALILFSFLTFHLNAQEKLAVSESLAFQQEMNRKFKDPLKSPLTKKDLKRFKTLAFFPIAKKYRVIAKITKTPNAGIFKFPTTTRRIVSYKKYGIISFYLDNQEFKLNIYQNESPNPKYKNHLFLPFLDKTNGTTSYSGGRFIDVLTTDEQQDGSIIINFNKAYNPYCAYNNRYSCPITPSNNYLNTEIKAGIMAYQKH